MAPDCVFVNVTHPSHMRDARLRTKIKSHTSRHNMMKFAKRKKEQELLTPPDSVLHSPGESNAEGETVLFDPAELPDSFLFSHGHFTGGDEGEEEDKDEDEVEQVDEDSRALILRPQDKHPEFLDCYNSFGVEHITRLWTYFICVFGPTRTWRPEMIDNDDPQEFRRSFIQFTVRDEANLESTLLLSLATLEIHENPGARPSTTLMKHYSRTLKVIQQRLVSGDRGDALLMAVLRVVILCLFYSDWNSFQTNSRGFSKLVHLRGGLDNLGWAGWFTYVYSWIQLRWANHLAQIKAKEPEHQGRSFTYPTHPYPGHVCVMVSKLPIGFQDVLLQSRVSLEIMEFLYEVSQWSSSYSQTPDVGSVEQQNRLGRQGITLALECANHLASANPNPIERLLCIGLLAFILSLDGQTIKDSKGLYEHMATISALSKTARSSNLGSLLVWLATVIGTAEDHLAPTAPTGSNEWLLLDMVVAEGRLKTWEQVKVVLKRFFFVNRLEPNWRSCWHRAWHRAAAKKRGGTLKQHK